MSHTPTIHASPKKSYTRLHPPSSIPQRSSPRQRFVMWLPIAHKCPCCRHDCMFYSLRLDECAPNKAKGGNCLRLSHRFQRAATQPSDFKETCRDEIFFSSFYAGDGGHCAASEATASSGRAGFGPSLNPGQCVVIAGNEEKAPADLRASVRQQRQRCTFQYGV